MSHLKNMIQKAKKTLASLVFKRKRSFKTLAVEEAYVKNRKPEDQEAVIIDLRFAAWRKYNSIGYSKTEMIKARVAFHAGFRSSQIEGD